MEDLNAFIKCENLEQRNKIVEILESIGVKQFLLEACLDLRVIQGEYFDFPYKPSPDAEKFTYQQFMEKYAMNNLHQKINETKVTLGMDNKRLSLALGHHRNYIARVLKNEHSEKFEKNLIKQLDDLIESKKIKVEELPKFVLSKEDCNSCRDAFVKDNDDLKKQLELYKIDYEKLKKSLSISETEKESIGDKFIDCKSELEYKTELLARKDDEVTRLNIELAKFKGWLDLETDHSEKLEKTISKLEKELDIKKKNWSVLNFRYKAVINDLEQYKNKSNVNKVLISLFIFACFSVGLTYILLNH